MADSPRKFPLLTRAALVRLGVGSLLVVVLLFLGRHVMIRMPGVSYAGELMPLSAQEAALSEALRQDVAYLAIQIGERHVGRPVALSAAAEFIAGSLHGAGYEVRRHDFTAAAQNCSNLEVEIRGESRAEEILVIGAHYDTVPGAPGANDNASGVAALLALARTFSGRNRPRTVRFVAFVNEEPPHFQTETMGSLVYARQCRTRQERIVGMISLETLGYYSDAAGSQSYPAPFSLFYPSTGNFIGFVGNVASRGLVRDAVASFRRHARFPSEGGAIPGFIPGVGWSDHWSFWEQGYPAVMVTDTAPFRYPYYHSEEDSPDKLDYDRMARVVVGLEKVVHELSQ